MRARELFEDYNQDLISDLTNILVGAKGAGASEIRTRDVVDQLYNLGYSITVNSIMPLLSNNPAVLNATPEIIKMTEPDGASGNINDTEDSADRVAAMAKNASNIG